MGECPANGRAKGVTVEPRGSGRADGVRRVEPRGSGRAKGVRVEPRGSGRYLLLFSLTGDLPFLLLRSWRENFGFNTRVRSTM